ncbi:MAG: hypothetical protein WCO06_02475 [Candidatus Roizmanbacteria bacterium]
MYHPFKYKFDDGPLPLRELRCHTFTTGNCRRAIQDYLYFTHNLFLQPEHVLFPNGYLNTGKFITSNEVVDLSLYNQGDIIYAERIKDKKNNQIIRSPEQFMTQEDYLINLHTAIFINADTIYHATSITGETCIWNINLFFNYYKIIAVKRVL